MSIARGALALAALAALALAYGSGRWVEARRFAEASATARAAVSAALTEAPTEGCRAAAVRDRARAESRRRPHDT